MECTGAAEVFINFRAPRSISIDKLIVLSMVSVVFSLPLQTADADSSDAAGGGNGTGVGVSLDSNQSSKPPLQGFLKHDSKGTPVVPEWKMDAGYDELIGTFYAGFAGIKLIAMNGPMGRHVVLGKDKLRHWKGVRPHPCMLKLTKLEDGTGGYYFKSVNSEAGPRGWIIPQTAEPHKVRKWAIYFMQ